MVPIPYVYRYTHSHIFFCCKFECTSNISITIQTHLFCIFLPSSNNIEITSVDYLDIQTEHTHTHTHTHTHKHYHQLN
ncbi:unnamed protein product [Periconia digitata]|uniref:Uncharacterized protein n=1 Tax=Periconia digitata TaxID=1303443 RepID=A0A9W4UJ92_9PLEO|nr:unnamed protein product [Periconia digitata]